MELKVSIEDKQYEFFISLIQKLQGVVKNYEIMSEKNYSTPNKDTIKAMKEAENRDGRIISLDEIIKISKEKVI
jgi:hypothetical protein